jgi:hypothetical protein
LVQTVWIAAKAYRDRAGIASSRHGETLGCLKMAGLNWPFLDTTGEGDALPAPLADYVNSDIEL